MRRAGMFPVLGLIAMLPIAVGCGGQDSVHIGSAPTDDSRPRPPVVAKPPAEVHRMNAVPPEPAVQQAIVVEVTDVDGAVIELRRAVVDGPGNSSGGVRIDVGNGAVDSVHLHEIREITFNLRPSRSKLPATIRLNEDVDQRKHPALRPERGGKELPTVEVRSGNLSGYTPIGVFRIPLGNISTLRVKKEPYRALPRHPELVGILVVGRDGSIEQVENPVVDYGTIWMYHANNERRGIRMGIHSLRGVDAVDWREIDAIEDITAEGDIRGWTARVTLSGSQPREAVCEHFDHLKGKTATGPFSKNPREIRAILPIADPAKSAAQRERAHELARRGPPDPKAAPRGPVIPPHPRSVDDPYVLKLTDSNGISVKIFRPRYVGDSTAKPELDWLEVIRVTVQEPAKDAKTVTAKVTSRDGSVRDQVITRLLLQGETELGEFEIPWRDVREIETEPAPPKPWPAIDHAVSAYYQTVDGRQKLHVIQSLFVIDQRGVSHLLTDPIKFNMNSWPYPVAFNRGLPVKYRNGMGMVRVPWAFVQSVEDIRTDEHGVSAEVSLLDAPPTRIGLLAVSGSSLSGHRQGVPFSIKFDEILALRRQ